MTDRPPSLRTARLILRPLTRGDVDDLVALDTDPEVRRYVEDGEPVDPSHAAAMIEHWNLLAQRHPGYGFWAAVDRRARRFLGWFHLRPGEGDDELAPELGYRLRRAVWGQGYATEGSRALIDHAFGTLGVHSVYAETMVVNRGSRRVMERVGMRLQRIFHAEWPVRIPGDEHGDVTYAISRDEWCYQRDRPVNLLATTLLAAGAAGPHRPAIVTPEGRTVTYGELIARSAQVANTLTDRGLVPGERVAVHTAAKTPDLLALHLACIRAGMVYVPLNSAYTATEVTDLTDDAGAAMVIAGHPSTARPTVSLDELGRLADRAADTFTDVARRPDDPASILYTSGTTGRPKGAVMSHANLAFSAANLATSWGFVPSDRLLHILPLFHTHGLFVAVHLTLTVGASMVLLDRFDPAVVLRHLPVCTVMMGVPTHYTRMLTEPGFDAGACAHLRLFTSGSAPMLASTHHEFTARTNRHIVERYGMTETCMLTSNPLLGPHKPGTVGPPLPSVEVRIDAPTGETGSIEVRGPNVFAGYWGRPELRHTEFSADGWFITGDLGRFDEDGYVEIVGRSKDLIISGGLNVYPKEVELVLDALDGVHESAVVGVPDADLGEAVVAVVVAEAGATIDPTGIRAEARRRLAGFKVPKWIVVADALPRNAMGKVEKARLRADLASDDQRP